MNTHGNRGFSTVWWPNFNHVTVDSQVLLALARSSTARSAFKAPRTGGGAGVVSVAIATFVTIPVDIDTSSTLLGGTAGQGGHDGTAVANKAIDGISAPLQGF